jgi:hypothetical protein
MYLVVDHFAVGEEIVGSCQKCNAMRSLQLLDVQVLKAAFSYSSTKQWDHKTNKQLSQCANYSKWLDRKWMNETKNKLNNLFLKITSNHIKMGILEIESILLGQLR